MAVFMQRAAQEDLPSYPLGARQVLGKGVHYSQQIGS